MNLIFTCGGTAGHINPAIAVANMMRERHPDCNILFIGAKGHMEEKLVPQAGYDLKCLEGSGLSRGKNLAAVKKNLHAVKCVREGVKACKKIFREFKPDVVIGTGGYASFPALYAAQSMGIPTCVHESNAVPGVTTRLAANKASRVLVAFEESVRHYRHPEKVEVVGMPVRREFIFDTKEGARKELGLSGFVVVSAFGSQGAKVMNETIADMIPLEQADGFPFHHIHATGSFGKEWMPQRVLDNGVDWKNCPALDIREYIYDMPTVMAAADIVIHYDPWWNVAAQNQATDRAYRIGQQNPVQVYKLIAQDTIEEKIVELQQAKQSLADTVTGTADGAILSMRPDELLQLLEGSEP